MANSFRQKVFQLFFRIYDHIKKAKGENWEEFTITSLGAFGEGSILLPYSTFIKPTTIFIGDNVHIRNNGWFRAGADSILVTIL